MDTTPKYIKMCEGAGEIQKTEIQNGDWFCYRFEIEFEIKCFGSYGFRNHSDFTKIIWLPRQDQLQEMVKTYLFHIWNEGHEKFHAMASTGQRDGHKIGVFSSLEQLWLAFVMHEKYGKVWDDEKEEWVEEK